MGHCEVPGKSCGFLRDPGESLGGPRAQGGILSRSLRCDFLSDSKTCNNVTIVNNQNKVVEAGFKLVLWNAALYLFDPKTRS